LVALVSYQLLCRVSLFLQPRTGHYWHPMNRSGFVGGSNFQIGWSPYEQDDEQILP